MNWAEFFTKLSSLKGVVADAVATIEAKGLDVSADLVLAEDVLALLTPIFPEGAVIEDGLKAAAFVLPVLEKLPSLGISPGTPPWYEPGPAPWRGR